jgi:hypothetical protein
MRIVVIFCVDLQFGCVEYLHGTIGSTTLQLLLFSEEFGHGIICI